MQWWYVEVQDLRRIADYANASVYEVAERGPDDPLTIHLRAALSADRLRDYYELPADQAENVPEPALHKRPMPSMWQLEDDD